MIDAEQRKGLRTWIEIDTKKLNENINTLKSSVGENVKICAAVKSNAYGHGLIDFSHAIEQHVDYIAVDSIVEGIRLRKEGIQKNIIVFGYTLPELFEEAIQNNIEITLSHPDHLKSLLEKTFTDPLKVHIKIDTGMHRQGFMEDQKDMLFNLLDRLKEKIDIIGVYTHFAEAKDPNNRIETEKQIAEFESWKKDFYAHNIHPLFHSSATAATVLYPETHNDMVRFGIGLYGYYPSNEVRETAGSDLLLQPILTWRSVITEIKNINTGESVGYNNTWKANRPSTIAIIPIGYWHGLSRTLSNKASLIIKGVKVPIIGMISMDMTIVDITDIPDVIIGEAVTIIGKDGNTEQYATDLISGSEYESYYETLTRINPLIKKFYI